MQIPHVVVLPHPHSLVGRVIRLPLRLIPKGAVVPVLTGINRGRRWIAGASNAGCWFGTYESGKQEIIKKHVESGMIAYDLGAHVGFYTLALSRLVGHEGHVFAFEPDAGNIVKLRRHLELNAVHNVTVVQAAVSSRTGFVRFSGHGATARIDTAGDRIVPTITLDDFIAAGYPAADFIKSDIEGAEYPALLGASNLIAQHRAIWCIGDEKPARCQPVFETAGYTISAFMGVVEWENSEVDFLALPRV